jgi:RHS repeat-associated protein
VTANNRLESDGTFDYTYDAEGNITSKTDGNTTWNYAWDNRNRMVQVEVVTAAATVVVHFRYDVFNRRTMMEVDSTGTGYTNYREMYFYDGDDVILDVVDVDGDGGNHPWANVAYLHGPAVDQVLAQDRLTHNAGDPNRVYWFVQDNLNSTRDLIDNAGNRDQHYAYDGFGNVVSGAWGFTRYMYTGREADLYSVLQYNRNRWYDPAVGRWMSEDPIGFEGDLHNLHRYAANSPTNISDPLGFEPVGVPPGESPGTTLTRFMLMFQHPLSRALFSHYVAGSGSTYVLSVQEATALEAERLSVDSSPTFFAALERARERADATCKQASESVQFSMDNTTDLPRALAAITNHFRGTVTARPDGTWSFQGTVEFRDRYDFDPLWFSTHRTLMGELLTIWGAYFISGRPFDVRGTFIASQNSNEAYVQWPGRWDDEL